MEDVRPEVLISRLTSDNETWRVDAERRLLALGEASVEPLVHALQHASVSVRIHAVHALARLKAERSIPAVIGALGDAENHGAVAIAAEKALIQWGSAVAPALLKVVAHGPEAIRPRALRALGKVATLEQQQGLIDLLQDPSAPVRTQAASALATLLQEKGVELIAPLLADSDKWVRYGVAEALVGVGSVRGEPALKEAANDPEEKGTHIQYWAEDLLDQIDDLRRSKRALP
jgi:HEAT repeat protein